MNTECAAKIRERYPNLPPAYFRHIELTGGGEAPSGRYIYPEPLPPSEVYPDKDMDREYILLGDDMQGFCLAFHLSSNILGELSPRGEWEPWPQDETIQNYIENEK